MLQQLTQPLQGLGQGRGGQKPVAHLLEGLLTEGREKVLPAAGGFLGSRQSPGAGYHSYGDKRGGRLIIIDENKPDSYESECIFIDRITQGELK